MGTARVPGRPGRGRQTPSGPGPAGPGGKPVGIRRGRATVTGERTRGCHWEDDLLGRLGGAAIRESGDLPRGFVGAVPRVKAAGVMPPCGAPCFRGSAWAAARSAGEEARMRPGTRGPRFGSAVSAVIVSLVVSACAGGGEPAGGAGAGPPPPPGGPGPGTGPWAPSTPPPP